MEIVLHSESQQGIMIIFFSFFFNTHTQGFAKVIQVLYTFILVFSMVTSYLSIVQYQTAILCNNVFL